MKRIVLAVIIGLALCNSANASTRGIAAALDEFARQQEINQARQYQMEQQERHHQQMMREMRMQREQQGLRDFKDDLDRPVGSDRLPVQPVKPYFKQ